MKRTLRWKPGTRAALTGALLLAVAAQPQISQSFVSSALADPVLVEGAKAPGFADVVEAVSPAVVSVRVEAEVELASRRPGFRFDRRFFDEDDFPFFRDGPRGGDRFFIEPPRRHGERRRGDRRHGDRHRGPNRFGMSQGSGFFVSDDGYIVTNHHVIRKGSKFTVVMNDGTEMEASLVGADPRTDLAVLKVEADREFTYVGFDDSDVRIGDWVVAVGNPFGLGGTVTAGIVSAHGRQIGVNRYDDFIQIDAAVNKGSSGGPAFNLEGEVIGVNTAIFSPSGGNVGIAFAIPASTASEIVNDLIDDGQVVRGWLGVQIQPVTEDIADSLGLAEAHGAIVAEAQPDSPALAAGIGSGDVITAVNGKKVEGPRALAREIASYEPESDVTISLWRDGETQEVTVTLGELELSAGGRFDGENRPPKSLARMGLELRTAPDGDGVEVVDVVPGSEAARRGLRVGDTIVSVNGERIDDPDHMLDLVREAREAGRKTALFQVRRGERSRFVAVPIAKG